MPDDFDNWSKKHGADGWAWNDVLLYFVKAEGNQDPVLQNRSWHGRDGPWKISSRRDEPTSSAFVEAAKKLGFCHVTDLNGPDGLVGASVPQINYVHNKRHSVEKAYLAPSVCRDNLHLLAHAHVAKILFDCSGDRQRAKGVQFSREGASHEVFARKEVIMSAGAFKTPQLLMLSGIGPRDHLKDLGISLVVDSPVGEGLSDTIHTPYPLLKMPWPSPPKPTSEDFESWATDGGTIGGRTPFFLRYKNNVTGDYDAIYGKSPSTHSPPSMPEVMFNPNLKPEVIKAIGPGLSLGSTLFRPKSRGWVRLNSSDPEDHPVINLGLLADQRDVDVLVEGIRLATRIGEGMVQSLNASLLAEPIPGCEDNFDQKVQSQCDKYLACVVRTVSHTAFQPYGTAKMGAQDDPRAVLDPRLKVKKVNGLRVADMSAIPDGVAGWGATFTIMLGEKAADLVKADWGFGR